MYSIFGWGYMLTKEDIQKIQQEISLNDYDHIRSHYLIKLQCNEYLFGVIIESIFPNENSVSGTLDTFKIECSDPARIKAIDAYQNLIKPIINRQKLPKYVFAMIEEE